MDAGLVNYGPSSASGVAPITGFLFSGTGDSLLMGNLQTKTFSGLQQMSIANVEPNKVYRFRILNAAGIGYFNIAIAGHDMTSESVGLNFQNPLICCLQSSSSAMNQPNKLFSTRSILGQVGQVDQVDLIHKFVNCVCDAMRCDAMICMSRPKSRFPHQHARHASGAIPRVGADKLERKRQWNRRQCTNVFGLHPFVALVSVVRSFVSVFCFLLFAYDGQGGVLKTAYLTYKGATTVAQIQPHNETKPWFAQAPLIKSLHPAAGIPDATKTLFFNMSQGYVDPDT